MKGRLFQYLRLLSSTLPLNFHLQAKSHPISVCKLPVYKWRLGVGWATVGGAALGLSPVDSVCGEHSLVGGDRRQNRPILLRAQHYAQLSGSLKIQNEYNMQIQIPTSVSSFQAV